MESVIVRKLSTKEFNLKVKPYYLALLILSLSCNFVTQRLNPVPITSTPLPEPAGETPFPSPVYIPPGCEGQPFATLPAATTMAQTEPLDLNPTLSTEQQLNVFESLVVTVNEVYVYPDFNGVDWKSKVDEYRSKVKAGLDTETFYLEMQHLIAELNDEHSYFESPVMVAQANRDYAGEDTYVGVGVYVTSLLEKNRLMVISVFPDSPAENSGILPHDSLIAVDGLPLVDGGVDHSERLLGPACSTLRLTLQSPGQAPRDLIMMRNQITSSLRVDARLVPTSDGSRVGYIYIPTFFEDQIDEQVQQSLEDFGELDGLILDNRMNGGGSSDVVEPILSYFTSGKVGDFVSRKANRPLNVDANPIYNSQTVPLVVLVGEETASFGEIFSGIMQDTGRARIVGQLTLGNVETLHGYSFPDDSELWIAEETFNPVNSHANWERDGIHPDVEAYADWDTFTFETDPAVLAAVELLGH